jgi:hypothetical protein
VKFDETHVIVSSPFLEGVRNELMELACNYLVDATLLRSLRL